MAFIAVLEADLRALSAEARRKYPAVKDAAEHAIIKLRSLPDPLSIARSDDILRIFLTACECKNARLSVISLACLQKLIAHDAVEPSALSDILGTLKEHADMNDESVQLKTLQTILTIFQSQLHPEDEESMALILGICLQLLENSRNPDSVHSTAAATLRQAVALIFDRVVAAEHLPISYVTTSRRTSRSNSVSGDVSRSMIAVGVEIAINPQEHSTPPAKDQMTQAAKLGLRLFEDLTSLASGGTAIWLRVPSLQRTFALDMIEYVLSNYSSIFRKLGPYQMVLRHQVCSLLMTSLRITGELEGEAGEPTFRRLVLRSVANVIRLYSSILVTECEVFLSMLVKTINLDLPLWHRIMVLEVLRGFCIEARILRLLFQSFDMRPENTNVVAGMIKALARVVTYIQVPDTSEESLVAVAGMFNSKAKGVEWSMEYDASGMAMMVASEAHAITLAVEGLLGVVFTVATLTDEAIDAGELDSPRCETNRLSETRQGGELATICISMVNAFWQTLLDALSLILSRSQGEAIVLEILKGYQAFTQACGVLRAVEPLDAFLASLCKFALVPSNDLDKTSVASTPTTGKRGDQPIDQRDPFVLTPKNVQALRTIFNIAHRLDSVLGQSWTLVLETLASLDRIIHSPHATTQEISAVVPRPSRETGSQSSDFNIFTTLDSQLFESSGHMSTSAVCSLLSALRQVSNDSLTRVASGLGQTLPGNASSVATSMSGPVPQATTKLFAVERMVATLVNNLHRAEILWNQIIAHLLELSEHENPQVRNVALDALDRCICAVLGSESISHDIFSYSNVEDGQCLRRVTTTNESDSKICNLERESESDNTDARSGLNCGFRSDAFECTVILPLSTVYSIGQHIEVRAGALKILLHVLERHGDKLYHSWPNILELLRSVANTSDKEFLPLGFQSVRVIMNDGLHSIPASALDTCIEVAGSYGAQRTDMNISLTAIGLLWTTSDFFARGVNYEVVESKGSRRRFSDGTMQPSPREHLQRADSEMRMSKPESMLENMPSPRRTDMDYDNLLLAVFGVIQGLGTDDRPEVRNSAIRTLVQSITSHGYKLSTAMWNHCLWNLVFPLVDTVRHLAAASSKIEWHGKELGLEGGKPVHMLVHHSRNTAEKQWDETLVLLLNGLSRMLRPFFVFLQSLEKFKKGWSSLLEFIHESITNGNKEVSFAAVNALHIIVIYHAPKGNVPVDFFEAAFRTYVTAMYSSAQYKSRMVGKARQELLRNLGELYVQAYAIFKPHMYLEMLSLVDLLAHHPCNASDNAATIQGSLPQVQRTILDILPLFKPLGDHLESKWPLFLHQLISYLPGDSIHECECCKINKSSTFTADSETVKSVADTLLVSRGSQATLNGHDVVDVENREVLNMQEGHEVSPIHDQDPALKNPSLNVISDAASIEHWSDKASSLDTLVRSSIQHVPQNAVSSLVFSERIINILLELYASAPSSAKVEVLPDIIASFGRCMSTRRDYPNHVLWRTAVIAFNHLIVHEIQTGLLSLWSHMQDCDNMHAGRKKSLFWKELADAYETFLVGTCGRAATVPVEAKQEDALQESELLENSVLDVMCNEILKSFEEVPLEIIQRFIDVLDRCASRTAALPLENVKLLPQHCSRFSLVCLQKLFELCRYAPGSDISSLEVAASKLALPVLLARCDFILHQFSKDESLCEDAHMPAVRIDELIFLLQELARLVLHPSSTEDLIPSKGNNVNYQDMHNVRFHLRILYGPLCELIISREAKVRQLLLVLLRLLGTEMGLL